MGQATTEETQGRQTDLDPAETSERQPIKTATHHAVSGFAIAGPFPDDVETIYFGMGCFWGAERRFWQQDNVYVTSVGYMQGATPHPTYEEVCSGSTGHVEAVAVHYRGGSETLAKLLKCFWESHDPAQGDRQGNDRGSQYRSVIYTTTEAQLKLAYQSRDMFAAARSKEGITHAITTDIAEAMRYYFAEAYHQQYLAKNPNGYCGLRGTNVVCPLPNT